MLVIDSADRLARNEDSEKVLAAMRAFARDWAQVGTTAWAGQAGEGGRSTDFGAHSLQRTALLPSPTFN